jgi:hypothetical protein
MVALLGDLVSGTAAGPLDLPLPLLRLLVAALHPVPSHRVTMAQVVGHPWVAAVLAGSGHQRSLCRV